MIFYAISLRYQIIFRILLLGSNVDLAGTGQAVEVETTAESAYVDFNLEMM